MLMVRYLVTVLFLGISLSIYSQDVEVIDIDGLRDILNRKSDTVYVLNFWATWCKPCTEEMPDLLKISKEYEPDNLKLILISLDLPSVIDTRLADFIKDNGISSRVFLLDDPDANKWIPLVDDSWSGSIPATLIYFPSAGYRDFHEGKVSYGDLKARVSPLIKKTDNNQ